MFRASVLTPVPPFALEMAIERLTPHAYTLEA
jgi:hypothetical protein